MTNIIDRDFYNRDPVTVAKDLIGKVMVRKIGDFELTGIITETEAYSGSIDKACHAYGGRKTTRTQVMYGGPGFSYVYFIYGLYHCLNIVTSPVNVADAVLIRAVSPLAFNREGKVINTEVSNSLAKNRYKKEFSQLTKQQIKNFCNGPSKLCMAFDINKSQNGLDLCTKEELWIEKSRFTPNPSCIMKTKRIGIDYAEEAKDFLWRYVYEGEVSFE